MQQLLEPQLVDLMHSDEQQLVVGRRGDQRHLLTQQLGQPQVPVVGEAAAFLAETASLARTRARPGPQSRFLIQVRCAGGSPGHYAPSAGSPSAVRPPGTK